jgi:excisionase family DNA binding protein
MIMSLQGESDVLFSTSEAASYLGLRETTIRTYVARGTLHPQKLGQTLAFPKSECERYLRENPGPGKPPKK